MDQRTKEFIGKTKGFLMQYRLHAVIVLFFFVWMLFFDDYNWIRIHRDRRRLKDLKSELEYYKEKINNDRANLHMLKADTEELERFAREQYHLKKKNEEVFIIIEE